VGDSGKQFWVVRIDGLFHAMADTEAEVAMYFHHYAANMEDDQLVSMGLEEVGDGGPEYMKESECRW